MFEQRWYRAQQESYRTRVTIKAADFVGKYVLYVLKRIREILFYLFEKQILEVLGKRYLANREEGRG